MTKRYESLDILRGLTVTFMCIVNNPGSWGNIYPPLRHASWTGCTPTDLVYPFFIFCAGCAMAFSYSKFDRFSGKAFKKLLKRSIGIFLVGLLINLYPFFPTSPHCDDWSFWQNYGYWLSNKRIMGVLQRIAMSYFIGGCIALWLRKPKKIMAAIAALCVVYTGILLIFGTEPGAFTLEGNVSRRIDVALLGENHVYHGYSGMAFDPEGPLGSLMGACTCLLGFLIGSVIVKSGKQQTMSQAAENQLSGDAVLAVPTASAVLSDKYSPSHMVCRIFVYGMLSLGFAELLSIWIPISKPLWSASYVFYAGGWSMLALAFLSFCVDICGIKKPFAGFKVMGMNALAAFVLSGVIAKSYQFVGWSSSKYFGATPFLSFCYACIFATVIFLLLLILYKKKIFIKL